MFFVAEPAVRALVYLLVFIPACALGASLESLNQYILQKNWDKADAVAMQLSNEPAIDRTALLFSIGMMAIERRRYEEAISSFREILVHRPELTRVRLELARALLFNGEEQTARLHFERVLGADIPAPVAANVRRSCNNTPTEKLEC